MNRINQVFSQLQAKAQAGAKVRKALIPFVTTGDPSLAATVPIMHALAAAGADIIELGVPFSDPMADGPTIQRASERALQQGVSLPMVLQCVATFRETNQQTPVVLMGYANPIERMGTDTFVKAAVNAGVDGVLVVDYPPEESMAFSVLLKDNNIATIFLLAPTSTPARIAQVAAMGQGYIYYVSLNGVTGSAAIQLDAVEQQVQGIKSATGLPVAVGFGIRDAQTAKAIGQFADGVVIGSKLIELIETKMATLQQNQGIEGVSSVEVIAQSCQTVSDFLQPIRQALDE
jgi:tryptophan synthase alpha chain